MKCKFMFALSFSMFAIVIVVYARMKQKELEISRYSETVEIMKELTRKLYCTNVLSRFPVDSWGRTIKVGHEGSVYRAVSLGSDPYATNDDIIMEVDPVLKQMKLSYEYKNCMFTVDQFED